MTPEERDLLTRYLDDLARAQPGPKDAEAAAQIERTLNGNPNATYVLVQHAIVSDAALHDAQAKVAQLQSQLEQARRGDPASGDREPEKPSFLGSLFGRAAPNNQSGASVGATGPWAGRPASAVPSTPQQGGFTQGGYPQGGYPQGQPYPSQSQPGPFSGGGGLGSFLRGAGTTAAGVAGGAFLFEGLSGMFGGHRGGFGGFGGGQPLENVTINEYGDDRAFDDRGGGYDDSRYDSDNGDAGGDDYS